MRAAGVILPPCFIGWCKMMRINEISIDLETFSDRDLSKCGVYKYVQSPNFEILLLRKREHMDI